MRYVDGEPFFPVLTVTNTPRSISSSRALMAVFFEHLARTHIRLASIVTVSGQYSPFSRSINFIPSKYALTLKGWILSMRLKPTTMLIRFTL